MDERCRPTTEDPPDDEDPPRRASLLLVTPDGTPVGRLPELGVAIRWWPDMTAVVAAVEGGVRPRRRRAPDARHRAPAAAWRRGDVPRRGRGPDRPLAARGRGAAPVRRHARRPAAPPPLGQARRPRRGSAMGGGGAAGPPDRARRPRGAGPELEPVEHLAAAAGRRRAGLAQGRCRRSSPTRATCCAGSRATPSRGCSATTGIASCSRTSRGEDQYDADEPELLAMVSMLVELQASWIGRVDELLRIGLPDWRGPGLTARIADTVQRRSADLPSADAATLADLVVGPPGPLRGHRRLRPPRHPRAWRLPSRQCPRHARRPDDPRLGRLRRRQPAAGPAGVPRGHRGVESRPHPRSLARAPGPPRSPGADARRAADLLRRSPRPARR